MAVPWAKIEGSEWYSSLSDDEKVKTKEGYFNDVVLPRTPPDKIDQYKAEFLGSPKQPGVIGSMVGLGKDVLGAAFGTLNAPTAFVLGSQEAQHLNPEEYNKANILKQAVISLGGGLESAMRSITQKGSWGTTYNDYYQSVTGKTIEDSLPKSAKWMAPSLEILGNIASDPMIGLGSAAGKSRELVKNLPKQIGLTKAESTYWNSHFKKIEDNLERYRQWESKQGAPLLKPEAQQLKDPNIAKAAGLRSDIEQRLGRPISEGVNVTPERMAAIKQEVERDGRVAANIAEREEFALAMAGQDAATLRRAEMEAAKKGQPLTMPQQGGAVAGKAAPIGDVAEVQPRVLPEVSQRADAWSKSPLYKPTQPEPIVALNKANQFRAEKGLPPASPLSEQQLASMRGDAALISINEFRAKHGLPIIDKASIPNVKRINSATARATNGAVAGIEQDENGNLTYDVRKGLLGTVALGAGIYGASKIPAAMKGRAARLAADDLAKYPALAKVLGGIGEAQKPFSFAGLLNKVKPGWSDWVDRFDPVKKVADAGYKMARVFSAHKDQAELKFKELQNVLRPVADDEVMITGLIKAHRDLSRAENGLKNPGGITADDAKQAIDEVYASWRDRGKDTTQLDTVVQGWKDWTKKYILDEGLQSGILSQKAYDKILERNSFYAAFDVLDYMPENMHNIPGLKAKEFFSVANQEVFKAMKGTERQIANPIESTLRKFLNAQSLYARNRVASTVLDDVNLKGLARPVADSEKEFAILKAAGKNPIMHNDYLVKSKKEFDTVSRFIDGNVERYLVPKELATAIKTMEPTQLPSFLKAIDWAFKASGGVFRKAATTAYLPFTISNAMNDAVRAFVISRKTRTTPGGVVDFFADWATAAKEGFKHEFGGGSKEVEKYIRAGGGFGYVGSLRSPNIAKGALFEKSVGGKILGVLKTPFDIIEKASAAVEVAPRLAEFKRMGGQGIDAAIAARDVTADFNKSGRIMRHINQWVPFINVRLQGVVNLGRAFREDPKGTTAKAMMAVGIPGLTTYAANRAYFSDLYDDIPEHIRENYFCAIVGTDTDKRGKTVPKYFVIPKGEIGRALWNPIEYALDNAMNKDRDNAMRFFVGLANDLSPVSFAREGRLSGSRLAGDISPPLLKGLAENWANLNFFTGREVVPYYMGKSKPPELQYKDNTPEAYKWMGSVLNISPLKLQNFAASLFASYGREGLDPSAMLRGMTGRVMKTIGGEAESRAWTVIKDIEQGYVYTRAFAQEMIKSGDKQGALKLMHEWNRKMPERIKQFNDEFRDHGIKERGGITKSYTFSTKKIRTVLKPKPKSLDPLRDELER